MAKLTLSEGLALIDRALLQLPKVMTSDPARWTMLAITQQEAALEYRRQMNNGPAMGLWQFERGGGVRGVMTHPAVSKIALKALGDRGIELSTTAAWQALQRDDELAAIFARLLLWTDPGRLPGPDEADHGWEVYFRNWRPGKPHPETWDAYFRAAVQCVQEADA